MTPQEAELQVLLSEKEHADKQIGSYLELQLKLLAFLLGAGSAGLGFVFARGDQFLKPPEAAIVIIVICIAGCVLMLQSVVTYGVALGYIYYKKSILGPRLAELLQLPASPLLSVKSFGESPARFPVFLASSLLAIIHAVATTALLIYAARTATAPPWVFTGCWILLAVTIATEALLAYSMKKVGGS